MYGQQAPAASWGLKWNFNNSFVNSVWYLLLFLLSKQFRVVELCYFWFIFRRNELVVVVFDRRIAFRFNFSLVRCLLLVGRSIGSFSDIHYSDLSKLFKSCYVYCIAFFSDNISHFRLWCASGIMLASCPSTIAVSYSPPPRLSPPFLLSFLP